MRQLAELSDDRQVTSTVLELTSAFEGIASMHISQIKDHVLTSQAFFGELWSIYSQLRVDQKFHFGEGEAGRRVINKELILLVTAEGSFSGDIDQRVIARMTKIYESGRYDVAVIGSHGATLSLNSGIHYVRSFKLPASDMIFNVAPLVDMVKSYKATTVLYPAYISLTRQEVRSIQMAALVSEKAELLPPVGDEISVGNYIFEPSLKAVVNHLEQSMVGIMLSDIILQSKLAQYASRFEAMHAARDKADQTFNNLTTSYNQARRRLKDERAKEVLNGLRKARS